MRPAHVLWRCALALLVGAALLRAADAQVIFTPGDCGASRLRIVDGVPVLTLVGTPYQMGVAQGTLLKQPLATLVNDYLLKRFSTAQVAGALLVAQGTLAKHFTAAVNDELRGLAEGSGQSLASLTLAQCFLDIMQDVHCSVLVLGPRAAQGGTAFMARNLDWPSHGVLAERSIVVVRHPAAVAGQPAAKATISIGWPGLLGTLSGINNDGVCLCMTQVLSGDQHLDGVPYALLYRQTLETCDTTAAAAKYLRDAKRTVGNNVALLDAAGTGLVLEVSAHTVTERPAGDAGWVGATNHFASQRPPGGRACPRLTAFEDGCVAGRLPLTQDAAKKLLVAAQQGELTLQSMLLYPASRMMLLSIGHTCAGSGPWVTIDGVALLAAPAPAPLPVGAGAQP